MGNDMEIALGQKIAAAAASEVAKGATNALVKAFIERLVTPYFSSRKTKVKLVNGARKYTRNIEFRTRCVPTIAIQGGSFVLEEVYEPLRLQQLGGQQSYRVDGYPTRLFNENRCVAIVDAAGMGKSTLTKYIIRRCLSDLKKIPLLVELRRIKQGQTIIEFVCNELLGKDRSESAVDDLVASLMDGNFIFLLDGYDEIDPELRSDLSEEISRISADFQYCNFWLTSRPDPALAGFTEFTAFEIANLTKDQAASLLLRYDCGRGLATTLVEKLDALPQVEDFLGNPLLVTLLYKAYDYKATIPIKRNIFFRQVFDALYQDHDLSKEGAFERRKKSALDIDDFHRFVRSLGFVTFKAGKVQYSQEEFTSFIRDAVERSQLTADVGKLKFDLLSAVPLFVRDGDDIRWSHKAFQDYFASQFIYHDSGALRDELIVKLFSSEAIGRYETILCLLGELDIGLLREQCILPFLEKLGLYDSQLVDDVLLARAFVDEVLDVYAVRGLTFRKKQESSGSWLPMVIETVLAEKPDAALSMDMRVTFSSKEGIAIAGFLKPHALRFRIVGKIDPGTFPWARSKGFSPSHVKPVLDSRVTCLKNVLEQLRVDSQRRYVVELVAHMADVNLPTIDTLRNLRNDVVRRKQVRVADSILEGF